MTEYRLTSGTQYAEFAVRGDEVWLRGGVGTAELVATARPARITGYRGLEPTGALAPPLARVARDGADLLAESDPCEFAGGTWRVTVRLGVADDGFALDCRWQLLSGEVTTEVSFDTVVTPTTPAERLWHFAPGLLYGGNPTDVVVDKPYPPVFSRDEMIELGVAKTEQRVTLDLPRLSADTGYRVDLTCLDATAPVVGGWDADATAGFFVGAQFQTELGRTGLRILAEPRGDHELRFCAPAVRPRRYGGWEWLPSPDHGHRPGAECAFASSHRLLFVAASTIPQFVRAFRRARAPYRRGEALTPLLPFSAAAELIYQKYDAISWREDHGYYRNRSDGSNSPHGELQMGWVDGLAHVFGFLHAPDELTRGRALRELDFILAGGQAATGFYYGIFDGAQWWPSAERENDELNYLGAGARRTTDTVRWGLKLLPVLARDPAQAARHDRLRDSVLRGLTALHELWVRTHDIGYLIDPDTGENIWLGATSGTLAIGALAVGAAEYGRPEFLDSAHEMAEHYYTQRIALAQCYGSCQDIINSIDQEGIGDLIDSFVVMYEQTRSPVYLHYASAAADLIATWVLTQNVTYPAGSRLAQLGIEPLGAMTASVQNLVGTPGLCIDSGSALLRLAEYTGDWFYAELLADILRACPQMIVRDPQLWGLPLGAMTESLNANDALADFGDAYLADCGWVPTALLAAWIEVPSVYVDPAAGTVGRVHVFDHLEARLTTGAVEISNPTGYPARATVQVRGQAAVLVEVPANATLEVHLPRRSG